MTTRSLLALAALAFSVTACGSDGPTENNGGNGTFTGNITGGISRSVTGEAVFGTSAVNDGFGLFLGNENDGFIFGREIAGILSVGTHTVYDLVNGDEEEAPASQLLGVIGITHNGADYICMPDGGTVVITSSSSSRLAGSVNVTAECITSGSETPLGITITGSFSAVGGDFD